MHSCRRCGKEDYHHPLALCPSCREELLVGEFAPAELADIINRAAASAAAQHEQDRKHHLEAAASLRRQADRIEQRIARDGVTVRNREEIRPDQVGSLEAVVPEHIMIFRDEIPDDDAILEGIQARLERDRQRLLRGEFVNPFVQWGDEDVMRGRIADLMRRVEILEKRTPRCGLGPQDATDPWTEIHNDIVALHARLDRIEGPREG
jgi:hypothetical protein